MRRAVGDSARRRVCRVGRVCRASVGRCVARCGHTHRAVGRLGRCLVSDAVQMRLQQCGDNEAKEEKATDRLPRHVAPRTEATAHDGVHADEQLAKWRGAPLH